MAVREQIAILYRDGYLDAAKELERLSRTINLNAELEFLMSYIRESSFENDVCQDQLRSLWTAFCLHHGLDVDTAQYDADLLKLWTVMEKTEPDTSSWHDFDSFDGFMCRNLV